MNSPPTPAALHHVQFAAPTVNSGLRPPGLPPRLRSRIAHYRAVFTALAPGAGPQPLQRPLESDLWTLRTSDQSPLGLAAAPHHPGLKIWRPWSLGAGWAGRSSFHPYPCPTPTRAVTEAEAFLCFFGRASNSEVPECGGVGGVFLAAWAPDV